MLSIFHSWTFIVSLPPTGVQRTQLGFFSSTSALWFWGIKRSYWTCWINAENFSKTFWSNFPSYIRNMKVRSNSLLQIVIDESRKITVLDGKIHRCWSLSTPQIIFLYQVFFPKIISPLWCTITVELLFVHLLSCRITQKYMPFVFSGKKMNGHIRTLLYKWLCVVLWFILTPIINSWYSFYYFFFGQHILIIYFIGRSSGAVVWNVKEIS